MPRAARVTTVALLVLLVVGGLSGALRAGSAGGPLSPGLGGPPGPPPGRSSPGGGATPAAVGPLGPVVPQAGGQGRLIVNTTDPRIVPNTGIRTNITDYFAAPFPANSAFQVSAEETIGGYVAVFGIFQNDQVFPVAFFSVFSNQTDATVHLAYWSNLTLVGGQSYDFALVHGSGTNWTLTMNGLLFGQNASAATYDFRASEATWAPGVSFSEVAIYASTLTTPGTLAVPLVFAVQRPTGWYLPEEAHSYLVTDGTPWGIQGRSQNASLAPGEARTGLGVPVAANGTTLWTGGPIAVSVGLGLSETMTRGTTIIEASASVVGAQGAPLPGVALAFSDQSGATFTPPSGATDGTGHLFTFVGTPNVSVSQNDLVVVTVTVFGYIGTASVPLLITPPTQLFLVAEPAAPATPAGGSVAIRVTAANASGAPGAGVLLLASVLTGSAKVTPFTTTDANGAATLVFTAPPAPAVVGLVVLVVAPGYWGHLAVNVTVWAPPPSLLSVVAPYLVGAGVGLAAVGAVLWVRARRRRFPPLPPLALPEGVPPVSRTRP